MSLRVVGSSGRVHSGQSVSGFGFGFSSSSQWRVPQSGHWRGSLSRFALSHSLPHLLHFSS